MQTETEIGNGAYESALAARAETAEYQFDRVELATEVPHNDHILTIAYNKPELEHYLARQKAMSGKTRIAGGALIGNEIKHDADTDFFDLIVTGGRKRKSDGIAVIREYDADECKRFPYEVKVKFVKRVTTWKFRVEASGDELLEIDGTLNVIQPVGEINGVPVEIVYTMNPLPEKQRQAYENAAQSKTKFKNGDQTIEVEPHFIEKAMKLFGGDREGKNASFVSVDGGRLERGPFTPELKSEFIAQIDPLFQVGVIDAICDFIGGGSD